MNEDEEYECPKSANVFGGGVLMCDLKPGHGGLHYDGMDNISWCDGVS